MVDVTKGSGNVFEDLGFEPLEAADLKARADLMISLRKFIRSQNWTKAQTAVFFNESQSCISDLMNGEIDRFYVKQLVHLLSIAGIDAHVSTETTQDLDLPR
ncbi:helix-turn-helix domain-containing protein [Chamaesiphon sp.]|uniref:helix-turn-helix domain-containing protein n=1 Tax=Chamaesiphon sp. TaxID=2814140 RepID=UPI003594269B